MKRFAVLLILLSLFIRPVRPACAAETVTFWHAMDGSKGETLNRLIDEFNATHDIKVTGKFVGVSETTQDRYKNSYNVLFKELLKNVSKGTPPDISQIYENWTSQFIMVKAIVPVEDFIATDSDRQELSDMVPAFLEANKYDGKLWTLPFNKSIYVLYYNRDMFKQAGLNPPKNWKEMSDIAKKFSKLDKNGNMTQWGLSFKPDVDVFSLVLLSSGEKLFDEQGKPLFNGEGAKKTIKYLRDLINSKGAIMSFEPQKDFMDGKCAMFLDTSSRIGSLQEQVKFNFSVAPCPSKTSGKILLAGTNLAMFSTSPEKQKASWEFIKYLTNKENTAKWSMETGYLPVRLSAIQSSDYQAFVRKNPDNGIGINQLASGVVAPKVPAWESIRGIMDDTLFDIISNHADVNTSLDNAVSLSRQLISNQ